MPILATVRLKWTTRTSTRPFLLDIRDSPTLQEFFFGWGAPWQRVRKQKRHVSICNMAICHCVRWRHYNLYKVTKATPITHRRGSETTQGCRHDTEVGEVPFLLRAHWQSWTYDWHRHAASSTKTHRSRLWALLSNNGVLIEIILGSLQCQETPRLRVCQDPRASKYESKTKRALTIWGQQNGTRGSRELKKKMLLPFVLALSKPDGQFTLDSDAFDGQLGWVLLQ